MAGAFRVRDKLADLAGGGCRLNAQADRDLLEVRRRIVDVVLFSIEERGAHVAGGVENRDVVQRSEPRRLGKQSKSRANHQILQRTRAKLRPAPCDRLIRLDDKSPHPAF